MNTTVLAALGKPLILMGQHVPANKYRDVVKSQTSGLRFISDTCGKRHRAGGSFCAHDERIFTFMPVMRGKQKVVIWDQDGPVKLERTTNIYVRKTDEIEIVLPTPRPSMNGPIPGMPVPGMPERHW